MSLKFLWNIPHHNRSHTIYILIHKKFPSSAHMLMYCEQHQQMRNDTLEAAFFLPSRTKCKKLTASRGSLSMEEGRKNSLKIHIVAHEFILRLFLIARYYSFNNNRNQLLPTSFLTPLSTPSVPCVSSQQFMFSHMFLRKTYTQQNIHIIIINDKREWVRFFEWESGPFPPNHI